MADGIVAAAAEAVDGARMMRDLAVLARWKKLTGTPEERESLRHIQGLMDEAGYRTELILHDAYVSLPGAASATTGNRTLAAITHSMSRSTPAGGLRAEVVDVGSDAGIAGRDDLRGRIILVDGIASPAAAVAAARAGAAAQLHVSPHEHLHEMCISPVWGSPSPTTEANLPSTVAVTISKADGEALRADLARGERLEVTLHAEVDTGWRKTPLLVAEFDGADGPDAPFVLFSGHHDTWYEGVMDNGAANATMVEVARVLAAHRGTWRRGLRLCFWSGHSQGRYSGSAWYADTHWAELERRCAVHVNVDSTGGVGATVLAEAPASAELAALAREVVEVETGQRLAGKRVGRNADQSFWGIGIPSLFSTFSEQPPGPVAMRNALGWWWHTPHDLLDKIDPAHLMRDTRVYARAIARLLTDPILPLDPGASAAALLAELRPLAATTGHGVPLDEVAAAAEAVRDAASSLRDRMPAEACDGALMRACRALVPLDYTTGDRFGHDPALPQPPWPVLAPLRDLARAEPGSDRARSLAIAACRARNRLLHGLEEARRALG